MSDFTAEFSDRSFAPVPTPGVVVVPQRWGWRAMGGPRWAELLVTGSPDALWQVAHWLRYGVVVRNALRTPLWWGFVREMELRIGAMTVGLGLDGMANKVAVRYTYNSSGGPRAGTTGWQQDDFSVATYGIKELLDDLSDSSVYGAAQRRNVLLTTSRVPQGVPTLAGSTGGDSVKLTCSGWWESLGWRYYENTAGLLQYTGIFEKEQLCGWGFAAPVGFTAQNKSVHQIDGKLSGLAKGSRIQVAGSTSNNNAFTVDQTNDSGIFSYTAATIGFSTPDKITDSAVGLGFLLREQLVLISGSVANNKYHRVEDATGDQSTIDPTFNGNTTAGGVGPSVTIKQGGLVRVTEAVVQEVPNANVTVTAHGMQIGQSFTMATTGTWGVGEIGVRARKTGEPGDGLMISLFTNASSAPGSEMASTVIPASEIGDTMGWISARIVDIDAVITYGTTYWVVIKRTGANDRLNYYSVEVSEAAGYAGGTLKLWTGSSWVARVPNASLNFQVWEYRTNTAQVAEIVATCGQFLTGTQVVDAASEVLTRRNRVLGQRAVDDAENLLRMGATLNLLAGSERELLATVTIDREVRIALQPAPDVNDDLMLTEAGVIREPSGAPLEPGLLPVGRWVTLAAIPTSVADALEMGRRFVTAAEYDAVDGRIVSIESRGDGDLWAQVQAG